MAQLMTTSVVRQIESLFEGGSAAGLSDRQLVERFVAGRDRPAGEAAFAALVARHGPMVLGVCRQLLVNSHDAEDAFQAVFLVLARRAQSVRDPDLLGNWLYGVALRTARKARGRLARRRRREEIPAGERAFASAHATAPADHPAIDREQAEALHAEVDCLPGTFRLAVVLCYFEGLSLAEAAARLHCPAGTVHSRLDRAREKLRRGLIRRGVVLSGSALAALLAHRPAEASVSSLLCDSTTKAAIAFAASQAAGGGAPAAVLAREVLKSMMVHRLTSVALALCLLAAVAGGAGWLVRPDAMGDEPKPAQAGRGSHQDVGRGSPDPAQPPDRRSPEPEPAMGRMTVVGRVLDPSGKPVADASVMIYGALKQGSDRPGSGSPGPLGQAAGDGSGQFRLDMPRISSATHHLVGIAARAPGFGMGWSGLDLDADQPSAEVTLRPEQVIEGRLFDIKGRVVPGVRVAVTGMGYPRRGPETFADNIDGPAFWVGEHHLHNPPAWPAPVVSDADGRFTIRGVGQGVRVLLLAEDPEYARHLIRVDTDAASDSKVVTTALEPARILTGRVTYADTGKPVPHAEIEIHAFPSSQGGPGYIHRYETDEQGIYRANPMSGERYLVTAYVPEGQPYLNASSGMFPFAWPKGQREHRSDLSLRRGTMIRGRVIEADTGRPVAGAALRFMGRPARADAAKVEAEEPDESSGWSGSTRSGPDGSYQVAVVPRPGTLIVLGPTDDFIYQELGERMIREGRPGGSRWYAHAFVACQLGPGEESRQIDVVIRRGTTIRGRVVGPDGQPIREARMLSRAILQPQPVPWRHFWGQFHGDVRDGHCELHGIAPDAEVPVFFFDLKNQLGAVASFSARAAKDGPITVQLQPCGMAMARLVDSKGKPLPGYRDPWLVSMIVTPGANARSTAEADRQHLFAEADYLSRIDPDRYNDLASDAQGRITLPALIPGATYRINDSTTADDPGGRKARRMFVAGAGEAIELGDILIEHP